jgi:predicted MFS family arabinose efflux permease
MVPLSIAHIGDTVPYGSRQATIGRYLAATTMGQVIGGSLAGLFAEFFGWRLAFIVLSAAALAVAARLTYVAAHAPRPGGGGAHPRRVTYRSLLTQRNTRVVWAAVLVEGAVVLGAVPYAGAYLRHAFGLDYLTIGLILGAFGLGGLAYGFSVRWLVATLGERGMVITGGLAVSMSYALITYAPTWVAFVPALAVIGMGFFTMHSTLQTRATELAPHARGTALSGFAFSLFLGQSAGVFLMSRLVDGPGYAVGFGAASVAVALLAVWLYRALAARSVTGER